MKNRFLRWTLRKRLCRWLYRRGWYRWAFEVSETYYFVLMGEDHQRGIAAAFREN